MARRGVALRFFPLEGGEMNRLLTTEWTSKLLRFDIVD